MTFRIRNSLINARPDIHTSDMRLGGKIARYGKDFAYAVVIAPARARAAVLRKDEHYEGRRTLRKEARKAIAMLNARALQANVKRASGSQPPLLESFAPPQSVAADESKPVGEIAVAKLSPAQRVKVFQAWQISVPIAYKEGIINLDEMLASIDAAKYERDLDNAFTLMARMTEDKRKWFIDQMSTGIAERGTVLVQAASTASVASTDCH